MDVGSKEDLSRVLNGKPDTIRISSAGAGKKGAQKGRLTLAVWNGWGMSNERMDYLFGSQDGRETGLFLAVGNGNWLVGLTECRRDEQRIEAKVLNSKIIISCDLVCFRKCCFVSLQGTAVRPYGGTS